ncbi:iron chelate uptake ABC transporter family permease subunit [Lipingzhangella sp. LS1_29]|uniref:Iron chelate uptake ABC transporter family permease subunit n=1 Tax=Lipingzhangella rawalii TaxID=2055835 RepID=A0ABU2H6G9_9ACTN|nr:iron chelate uptake ABC transporter family permease subunit [Lipingzhangella rawalii]MDS1270602.1 iron chelate uptake ABC transporter family permease subunit [Lipingzhangella rawalii]
MVRRSELLPAGTRVLGPRGVSLRIYGPAVLVGGVFTGLALFLAMLSITLGDFDMRLRDVPAALTGQASPLVTHIVVDLRLPRVLTGLGVGAALAMSGMLLQRLAHNPLVSPDIIGINAGASTAAVSTIVVVGGTALTIASGALLGAVTTAVLLYLLAYKQGVSGYRLVLIGIGVTAMLTSVTSYLMTRTDLDTAARAMFWLTGSLSGRGWPHAVTIGIGLLVFAPLAFAMARQIRLLQLGDDTARALGGRVQLARAGLLFTAAGLSAMSVAVAGPVTFVALVAPQIVRRLLHERVVGLLPAAACGAVLVIGADLIARTAFGGTELPAGVITGALGGPYMLYLLARTNRIGRGG